MSDPIAFDDKAGKAYRLDNGAWVETPVAGDEKGTPTHVFDGKEWTTIESQKATPASKALSAVGDVAGKAATAINTGINWAGTQFTKGASAVAGAPATLGELGKQGASFVGEKLGVPELGRNIGGAFKNQMTFGGLLQSPEDYNKFVFGSLGAPEVNAADVPALTLKPPLLKGGKINIGGMLDAGMQAIPGMLALPAGAGAQALSPFAQAATTAVPAFTGGALSEAAGQATKGTPYEILARVLAATGGYMLGSKLVTPLPANLTPQQQRAVELAKNAEPPVPLSVAQETGRGTGTERLLSRWPTSAGPFDRLAQKQGQATDALALNEMGFKGNEMGQETMKAARNQAGGAFDEAIANTPKVELTPDFYKKGAQAIEKYTTNTADSEIIKSVANKMDDFLSSKLNPTSGPRLDEAKMVGQFAEMTGEQYQNFRSGMGRAIQALYKGGKPLAAEAMRGVQNALDDAAEATLPEAQVAAWHEARKNYANFKILEKATNMGTVASRSSGTLAPSALTQALRARQGDAFSRTTGGLNDIATIKQYLADTFPNSGTPSVLAPMQGLMSGGAGAGALGLTGAAVAGAMNPAIALPAAALAGGPNLLARAMTGGGPISDVLRNYLANQAMTAARPTAQGMQQIPFALAPGIAVSAPGYPRLPQRR